MPKQKKKLPDDEKTEQEALQEAEEQEEKTVLEEIKKEPVFDKEAWTPKTEIGKKVRSGEIKDINEILDKGQKIAEPEIVDILIPDLKTDLLLVGQSKGKFGGGQRRVFRQTQKKTREGNKPRFATVAIVGNENGYIGLGYGKSKETVPAREKAIRNAKLNLIKIKRGCGSWQCGCGEPHTIPYTIKGKSGSVIIKLMPAPKGTGLCAENECSKILKLAGIQDVWSKTYGKTSTKMNLIYACVKALRKLIETKTKLEEASKLGAVEGKIKKKTEEIIEENETGK